MTVPEVCVLYATRVGHAGAEVLLGRKRTGLGEGKVVAPGGKLEPGERPDEAALRELHEEVGPAVVVTDLRHAGVQEYRFPTKPSWDQDSHVFLADYVCGEEEASAELEPFWVPVADIPYPRMWADAARWLPQVLRGGNCGERYTFGSDLSSLVDPRAGAATAVGTTGTQTQ